MSRPECFEFAINFLGSPEAEEIRLYVENLEAENGALRAKVDFYEHDKGEPLKVGLEFMLAAARVEGQAELLEVIRQFLYEPLPGIALPEKYEKPYTVSQESWNKRMDWLIAALERGKPSGK